MRRGRGIVLRPVVRPAALALILAGLGPSGAAAQQGVPVAAPPCDPKAVFVAVRQGRMPAAEGCPALLIARAFAEFRQPLALDRNDGQAAASVSPYPAATAAPNEPVTDQRPAPGAPLPADGSALILTGTPLAPPPPTDDAASDEPPPLPTPTEAPPAPAPVVSLAPGDYRARAGELLVVPLAVQGDLVRPITVRYEIADPAACAAQGAVRLLRIGPGAAPPITYRPCRDGAAQPGRTVNVRLDGFDPHDRALLGNPAVEAWVAADGGAEPVPLWQRMLEALLLVPAWVWWVAGAVAAVLIARRWRSGRRDPAPRPVEHRSVEPPAIAATCRLEPGTPPSVAQREPAGPGVTVRVDVGVGTPAFVGDG